MSRFFNSSGPIKPESHYHIDSLTRVDWQEIQHLIGDERYFVLHAPRQTGKTSTLLGMMLALNAGGNYTALYVNIEAAQAVRGDSEKGMQLIAETIASAGNVYKVAPQLESLVARLKKTSESRGIVTALLTQWAQNSPKPIVLLLDEVDALVGDTLISLLRQIRAGYAQRPQAFPQSIVLCGVRDVRDYRIHTKDQEIITGGSAFNIKAKSLRMGNFTAAEVRSLFEQHTRETGQVFDQAIYPELWQDTYGQPWLVNALGNELVWEYRPARDRSLLITLEQYFAARELLIHSRATHLDQLVDKLREARVHSVISRLLAGDEEETSNILADDILYVEDLGLIKTHPQLAIANRIYREVIPRELTWAKQVTITYQQEWYITPEHRLDIPKLLAAFQQFFRENADSWIERFDYKEAGPQLLMQAFLQRIINGGGRINREYALGRKRTDLSIEWPVDASKGYYGEVQRIILELKILRGDLPKTIAEGVSQTAEYAKQWGAAEAHLIIFNRDPQVSWDKKIWQSSETWEGIKVGIWGC